MKDFEIKDELITKIRKYHPGECPKKYKHFAHYTGGMADTGDWHFEIMIKDSMENLIECLALLFTK